MANGPLGGFMPTPAAPAQPPSVKLDTTAVSRGNFNTFLKNMNGATSLNPPSMAPSVGAPTPLMAPTMSNIDIFNPDMQMMREGGNVAPRSTNIMGQPHMLAYITPQEGGILRALGGSGTPGPLGIPSFAFGDPDADADESQPGGPSESNGDTGPGEFSDTDALGGFSDSNVDDSAPDEDIDYTDPDYGYTTQDTDTGKDDMDRATEIGQAVAAAQAAQEAQDAKRDRALDAVKQNIAMNAVKSTIQGLQQQSVQPSFSSAMTGRGGTTGVAPSSPTTNVAGASTTNFSNVGSKGLEQDPLGLSLQGVGLGPDMATPSISSVSPTSGPNTDASITGFGGKGGKDVSDFSLDIDALSNVEDQAKKGSFPALDKFGFIGKAINALTKGPAQTTISNIAKGFAPTYDKDGNITGTTGFGIGMGQPSSDVNMSGGGKSVEGYEPFDDTSPSLGMYDGLPDIGGDESEPIIKPIIPKKDDDEEEETNIGALGAANPFVQGQSPVLVESPFTTNVGDFRGTGFDAGDLNALIAQITRQNLPTAMAKGGIAGFANGGLIKAVDDFLATGT